MVPLMRGVSVEREEGMGGGTQGAKRAEDVLAEEDKMKTRHDD